MPTASAAAYSAIVSIMRMNVSFLIVDGFYVDVLDFLDFLDTLDILEALDALQQFFSVTSDFVNQAFVIFRALLVAKPSPLIEVFHYIIYMHEEQTEAAV